MAILIKFKDKIMYDPSRGEKEQLFSITQTYSGALYLKRDTKAATSNTDIHYKIATLDEDVLSVGFPKNKDVTFINNLEVIGKTETDDFVTKDLNINGVKLPNSLTAPADAPEKDITIIPRLENDWVGIDIDSYLKDKIKTHFEINYKTIPTGAIHWCYMTLEEYDKCSEDSILKKDFLLCDGRRYSTKEYPNLAKLAEVLKNQKVTHHIKTSKFYYPDLRNSDVGDGEHFYVPDLRHMFISNTTDTTQIGRYLPDCKGDDETVDHKQHRHFIAYGSYDVKPFNSYHNEQPSAYPNTHVLVTGSSNIQYKDISSEDYTPTQPVIPARQARNNPQYTFKENDEVGILPLYNNPRTGYKGGMIGFGKDDNNEKVNSVPADIFFCRNNTPVLDKNFVGKSSCDINSFVTPDTTTTETTTDTTSDYTSISKGHENYPDFYAMLPLIKI